jgi:predicted acylesterase/phospholipase RssA
LAWPGLAEPWSHLPIVIDDIPGFSSRTCKPAVPAINIEGRFYRDGGILSNTPTEVIFDDIPLHNSRIFAVQLWNPKGPVPRNPGGSASAKGHSIFEPVTPRGSNRRTGCGTSSANWRSNSRRAKNQRNRSRACPLWLHDTDACPPFARSTN